VTQSRLIKSAQQVLERNEQRHALALAECERQVRENETKLADLERYRAVYLRDFDQRAHEGMNGAQARTFHTFIARVAQAVSEQQELLSRARDQHAEELRKWRAAARRTAALKRIIQRRERAAQQQAERSDQAAADAHAQRSWAHKGARRGN
jgi:flagellar protein FliJ